MAAQHSADWALARVVTARDDWVEACPEAGQAPRARWAAAAIVLGGRAPGFGTGGRRRRLDRGCRPGQPRVDLELANARPALVRDRRVGPPGRGVGRLAGEICPRAVTPAAGKSRTISPLRGGRRSHTIPKIQSRGRGQVTDR
jgi:hypothetical protein